MYNQEDYQGAGTARPMVARALTYNEACEQARVILGAMDGYWLTATCEQIQAEVCYNCSLFVGEDPIRIGLCGTAQCPPPEPPPPPQGAISLPLLLGIAGVGVLGVLAIVVATRKKTVLIARVS